jgi:hypothetical protein
MPETACDRHMMRTSTAQSPSTEEPVGSGSRLDFLGTCRGQSVLTILLELVALLCLAHTFVPLG